MNKLQTSIVDLKDYDLVFTTSFENNHGVSGHLFELIEYHYICRKNFINSVILITDGTPKEVFLKCIRNKYNFSFEEYEEIVSTIIEHQNPKILITKNICVVDGAPRFNGCTLYCNNIFMLRCSASDFSYFNTVKNIRNVHILQDFNLYNERYEHTNFNIVHYIKKILWKKYIFPKSVNTGVSLFYLTTNCRYIEPSEVKNIIEKNNIPKTLIITNDHKKYECLKGENVIVESVPIENIFERFDRYIYTSIPGKFDCSPRFIVECEVFGKEVVYELDYIDPGVNRRKIDMQKNLNDLLLKEDDYFVEYVKGHINE